VDEIYKIFYQAAERAGMAWDFRRGLPPTALTKPEAFRQAFQLAYTLKIALTSDESEKLTNIAYTTV